MPSTRTLLAVITLGILSLSFVRSPALAQLIDTSSLTERLKSIEQELSGDTTGLSSLISELEEAAEGSADDYLQFTHEGKTVTFFDVAKTAWFYSHVLALVELGIVSGYKDEAGNLTGSYGPGDNVTRAESLKIAFGSAGVDPSSCAGSPAHPQAKAHWAKQYVVCAEERKLGLELKDALNGPATRAEVLHYALKAFETDIPEGTPPFADSKSHKYKNDIAYAYALGIISGDTNPDGSLKFTFRPNDGVVRAEAAKIFKLAIELL